MNKAHLPVDTWQPRPVGPRKAEPAQRIADFADTCGFGKQAQHTGVGAGGCRCARACCKDSLYAFSVGKPLCAAFCFCFLCAQPSWAEERPVSKTAHDSAQGGPPLSSASTSSASTEVKAPRVVSAVSATYPANALVHGKEARVEVIVTVLADGTVGDVDVVKSAAEAFNGAAIAAVRQWRFEPATRGGKPIDSRIRVPFQFSLPKTQSVSTSTTAPKVSTPVYSSDTASRPPSTEVPIEVTVRGQRKLRSEDRSVSDFRIERNVLAAAPREEGADILRSAPGLYIGRARGPAVAHTYMLRGFDAEHGQDIEFRVGGLPINMPSHIHGQGYSDLSFLIGDTVRELRVTEGVSDPRQGDFAVAGSINVALGVEESERGIRIRSGYGSFNTFRQLVRWAPKDAPDESFGAVQYMSTNGFGENRGGHSGSAILQHRFGSGKLTYRALGILHVARANTAGVLRKDDIDSGEVCFLCVYPYPTAMAQNALANRFLAGFFADYAGNDGANGEIGLWLGYDSFRNQQNFTGFLHTSRTLERVAGRGDLIEQQNRTFSLGLTGRYRSPLFRPTSWANGTIEVGADGRLDVIDQAQNLLDAFVRSQTWDERVDASIRAVDLGFWGDVGWNLTRYVTARFGLRADVLSYDADDRLGNFAPLTRPQDEFIQGFRRSALGVAWGPRASVEIRPLQWLAVQAAYGEGYRSPQARLLEDGETTPFSKVRSADFGFRFDWGDPMQLTVGGYYTRLSNDVALNADEGRLERVGATQRLGAVVHAVTRPAAWLVGSFSFTFVDATLLEPPPPTADEPQPPFEDGQQLPFVPPIVVRADLGTTHTFAARLAGHSLRGRAGLGFSFLSSRPLPFGDFADPVALLDASLGLTWGPLNVSFEMFNVLDSEYAAIEYSFPSDWNPNNGRRSRMPTRHIAAGAPLSWMLSLGATL